MLLLGLHLHHLQKEDHYLKQWINYLYCEDDFHIWNDYHYDLYLLHCGNLHWAATLTSLMPSLVLPKRMRKCTSRMGAPWLQLIWYNKKLKRFEIDVRNVERYWVPHQWRPFGIHSEFSIRWIVEVQGQVRKLQCSETLYGKLRVGDLGGQSTNFALNERLDQNRIEKLLRLGFAFNKTWGWLKKKEGEIASTIGLMHRLDCRNIAYNRTVIRKFGDNFSVIGWILKYPVLIWLCFCGILV